MQNSLPMIHENIEKSELFSQDLAPITPQNRTWSKWNLAAIWVGMAVCIPTYILASYMSRSGLSWQAALIIIGLANLVITIPMILNGHAGVKYGIPFPVFGRAAFGINGIHIPSMMRALVACGWFGVQTWIGGLAIYAIYTNSLGIDGELGLSIGKFFSFGIFWLINIFFIYKGTESIMWLEDFSAPILILIGVALLYWAYQSGTGFSNILQQSEQLQNPTASLFLENAHPSHTDNLILKIAPLKNAEGLNKATEIRFLYPNTSGNSWSEWQNLNPKNVEWEIPKSSNIKFQELVKGEASVQLQFRNTLGKESSILKVAIQNEESKSMFWDYLLWFTAMVGFWATMSISISDITRYAKTQKDQIAGQLIGLPGTMIFYSFVGIFVTSAAIVAFSDVLIAEDAPWDPVSLISKFNNPTVVIFAQIAMLVATLSTNIAANVIAPANAFSNLFPQKISFKTGGLITGIVGILICPWWLLDEISSILIFVSGLLGPVVAILIADYFIIRKKNLDVENLFQVKGLYSYNSLGMNYKAIISLLLGIFVALIGFWVPEISFLYSLSWFSGFIVSFVAYYLMMKNEKLA